MAKSRSESSFLPFSSLRGAKGDGTISRDPPRGREQCLARAKNPLFFVIARSAATKQSFNPGQPGNKQELKAGGVNSSFGTYREA